jgi:hypothetical protein
MVASSALWNSLIERRSIPAPSGIFGDCGPVAHFDEGRVL